MPAEDAEAIAGDLEETLNVTIVPRRGVRPAAFWYWRQVSSIVWSHLRQPAFDATSPRRRRMTMPIRQDLAYGWRTLRARPAFTIVAVLMLAVGIGATVAIFSLVNALMLRPLPFSEPDRLMLVHMLMPERDAPGVFRQTIWSYPKYRRLRDEQHSFQSTALFVGREYNLTGSRSPARVSLELVEHTYFNLLGVTPQVGRTFTADETKAPGSEPMVVLGYGFWVSRFGGDASIVGRTIGLNGVPHTILGVMPRGFSGLSGRAQVWIPITTIPASDLDEPFSHSYQVVARRASNVSISEAQAEVRLLGERIDQHYTDSLTTARWGAVAIPLNDQRIDPLVRRSVLLLLAAVGSVLLIVCVNLANLTLVRALARQREVAIRLALGASRLRIIRQLMTENLLLAALGTVAGLFVAYGAIRAGAALLPEAGTVLPRGPSIGLTRLGLDHLGLDGATLIFTMLTGVASAVLFGLGPAWRTSRHDLTAVMKAGSSGAVSRVTGSALRNLLLIGEMALALVLLTAGGLMLTSVMRLQATSLGFDPRSLLTAGLSLPDPQYRAGSCHSALRTAAHAPRKPTGNRVNRLRQLCSGVRRLQRDACDVSRAAAVAERAPTLHRSALGFTALLRDLEDPARAWSSLQRPRSRRTAEGGGDQRNGGASVLAERRSHRQTNRRRPGRLPRRRRGCWHCCGRSLRCDGNSDHAGRLPAGAGVGAIERHHLRPERSRAGVTRADAAPRAGGAGSGFARDRREADGRTPGQCHLASPDERVAARRILDRCSVPRRARHLRRDVAVGGAAHARDRRSDGTRRRAWRHICA